MSRLLSGITHALVTVSTREEAKATNTFATVDLCFGPGDDTALSGFKYTRNEEGRTVWNVPMYEVIRNGRPMVLPVLKGDLMLEATRMASQAIARIKKDLGGPAWGVRYRILKDQVLLDNIEKSEHHGKENN